MLAALTLGRKPIEQLNAEGAFASEKSYCHEIASPETCTTAYRYKAEGGAGSVCDRFSLTGLDCSGSDGHLQKQASATDAKYESGHAISTAPVTAISADAAARESMYPAKYFVRMGLRPHLSVSGKPLPSYGVGLFPTRLTCTGWEGCDSYSASDLGVYEAGDHVKVSISAAGAIQLHARGALIKTTDDGVAAGYDWYGIVALWTSGSWVDDIQLEQLLSPELQLCELDSNNTCQAVSHYCASPPPAVPPLLPPPSPPPNVEAYDCSAHPNPHQIVGCGTGNIQLVELDMLTGTYTTLYTFSDSPFALRYANAIALNPVDGIAYGKFTDLNDQDFFCRFSADPSSEPLQCLCALSAAGKGGVLGGGELNSGTIVNDVYYVGQATYNLRAVPGVSSLTTGSPGTECPGSWILGSRDAGFSGGSLNFAVAALTFDVSALGLGALYTRALVYLTHFPPPSLP